MKKVVALAIVMSSYGMSAMDSPKAPIIVLPHSQQSTPRNSFEITPRSSFDTDSDFSDWSRENSPRPIPEKLTNQQCGKFLKGLDKRNKEIYLTLLINKNLNKPLGFALGFSLYFEGLSDQKNAPYIGTTQYFLTNAFKKAIKAYFNKGK